MECKVYTGHDLRIAPAVLIETLWNVKEDVRHRGENLHTGINRNIVECKDLNAERDRGSSTVLIETLWNVKSDMAELMAGEEAVLIETLWNVKVDSDGNYTEFPEY